MNTMQDIPTPSSSAWLGDVASAASLQYESYSGKVPTSSAESWIGDMTHWFPSYSRMLLLMEHDPHSFRIWDGKTQFGGRLQSVLDQWIESDRPEIPWPTLEEFRAGWSPQINC